MPCINRNLTMEKIYNPFSLTGKTILVTGASSGIGRAIAVECSKMGAKLLITARNEQRLKETMSMLNGENHQYIVADLTNDDDLQRLIDIIPVVEGLVNCAGVIHTLPFQFVDRDKLEKIMNINFMASTLLSAGIVKRKKIKNGGSIVFLSSASGKYIAAPANSMYTASKGAIDGMAKAMAVDLAYKKIRVNTINPGMIQTDIMSGGSITNEQLEENALKMYPLKRYGRPEEVAYIAVYLLSDASEWMTGSNILIDGGLSLQ